MSIAEAVDQIRRAPAARSVHLPTLELVLQLSESQLGRGPWLWMRGDLTRILHEVLPEHVSATAEQLADVPSILGSYLGHLHETGGFASGSASYADLTAELATAGEGFAEAMSDPNRWGPSKTIMMSAIERGLDITDDASVESWLEDRGAELTGAGAQGPSLPPVHLPSDGEVLEAVHASPLLDHVRALVEWLDTGRPQTDLVAVSDTDELPSHLGVGAAEVPYVVDLARELRIVRSLEGRLVPVANAAPLLGDPVPLWLRALDTMDEVAGHDVLAMIWLQLYHAGQTPLPMELLRGFVAEGADRSPTLLPRLMVRLEQLGAVRTEVADDPIVLDHLREMVGRHEVDPTLVSLTPLGVWAVNRRLRAEGVEAPSIDELAELPLAGFAPHLVGVSDELMETGARAWVDRRTPEEATAELIDFVVTSDDPRQRMVGLLTLDKLGRPGMAATREIRERGGVAGAVAFGWLLDRDPEVAADATEAELVVSLAEQLLLVHLDGVLLDQLAEMSRDDVIDMMGRLAGAEHPRVLEVLDAVVAGHPDQAVSKEARRSAYKVRARHGG